jgi:hypothetical protein
MGKKTNIVTGIVGVLAIAAIGAAWYLKNKGVWFNAKETSGEGN